MMQGPRLAKNYVTNYLANDMPSRLVGYRNEWNLSSSQLPDPGDLPLRVRRDRRFPGAGELGRGDGRGHHRALRRPFHGGNGEAPQSGKNRAHPGPGGGVRPL